MARSIANLSAVLEWDLDDFERGTRAVEATFKGIINLAGDMADAVAAAGRRMTVGITAPVVGLSALFTKAAADAAELQSAFNYTFGRMSGGMNRWAEETGDAMGRATQEMQKGALAFGQLFQASAPTEEAAARMSQKFTVLAQDAASFFNTDFDTAMGKIRSGLTGESEPLRDFGVFLNEAAVKAKALEMGLIDVGQELNEYGKVMARAVLIEESLAAASGDVIRTASSLTNLVRKIKGDIAELSVEIGEILEPYAQKLARAVEALVGWFNDLSPAAKETAVLIGIFAASLGPLTIALSSLAIFILPLVLLHLNKFGPAGRVALAAFSAIINPIGTLAVMIGKLLPQLALFAARFTFLGGPVGWAMGVLMLFADRVIDGLQNVWDIAKRTLGPAMANLFDTVGDAAARVTAIFEDFSQSPIGQTLAELIALLGDLVEVLVTIAGSAVVGAFNILFSLIGALVNSVTGAWEVMYRILSGDWPAAWEAAGDMVENVINSLKPLFDNLVSWITGALVRLDILEARTKEVTSRGNARTLGGGSVTSGGLATGDLADLDSITAPNAPAQRSYVEPGKPKRERATGRRSRVRTGPSAEELRQRREELALEKELAVAREKNDIDEIRRLEKKRDLARLIEQYERAGLAPAKARVAAERDLFEIESARLEGLRAAIVQRGVEVEYQNDFEHLRYLEDEEYIRNAVRELQQDGVKLSDAQRIASLELLEIEKAREASAARRIERSRQELDLELARIRGDSQSEIDRLSERLRVADRASELEELGVDRADALAQAQREAADRSQAYVQGTFRDAFKNGLRAAMDGDLKGFFERWMKERTFNALNDVLNRLADSLANLLSGNRQNGGILGSVLGALGFVSGGSKAGAVAAGASSGAGAGGAAGIPGWNTGGSGVIKGHPGIDRNLLSLNGNPIARVSSGELLSVERGGARGGRQVVNNYYTLPSEEFWSRVDGRADGRVAAAAPGIAQAGSSVALDKLRKANTRRLG
jgi:hypothetical protein